MTTFFGGRKFVRQYSHKDVVAANKAASANVHAAAAMARQFHAEMKPVVRTKEIEQNGEKRTEVETYDPLTKETHLRIFNGSLASELVQEALRKIDPSKYKALPKATDVALHYGDVLTYVQQELGKKLTPADLAMVEHAIRKYSPYRDFLEEYSGASSIALHQDAIWESEFAEHDDQSVIQVLLAKMLLANESDLSPTDMKEFKKKVGRVSKVMTIKSGSERFDANGDEIPGWETARQRFVNRMKKYTADLLFEHGPLDKYGTGKKRR